MLKRVMLRAQETIGQKLTVDEKKAMTLFDNNMHDEILQDLFDHTATYRSYKL